MGIKFDTHLLWFVAHKETPKVWTKNFWGHFIGDLFLFSEVSIQ